MPKKTKYTDDIFEDIDPEKLVRVYDMLPSPEELARAPARVKITIGLTLSTIEYFKEVAEKHNTQYQRLIRQVLDEYVAHHKHLDEVGKIRG